MNAAAGIAYVYENPKPLDKIKKLLKDSTAAKLKEKVQAAGDFNHVDSTGALWEAEDTEA